MDKETKEIQKPIDVYYEEEGTKLRQQLVNIIQESVLPLYLRKTILVQTTNELITAINQSIQTASQQYYESVKESEKATKSQDN